MFLNFSQRFSVSQYLSMQSHHQYQCESVSASFFLDLYSLSIDLSISLSLSHSIRTLFQSLSETHYVALIFWSQSQSYFKLHSQSQSQYKSQSHHQYQSQSQNNSHFTVSVQSQYQFISQSQTQTHFLYYSQCTLNVAQSKSHYHPDYISLFRLSVIFYVAIFIIVRNQSQYHSYFHYLSLSV